MPRCCGIYRKPPANFADGFCVTGGSGYVGHARSPILEWGHRRRVLIDTLGSAAILEHPRFARSKGDRDVRHTFGDAVAGGDAVIILACISNDTSFALDERISNRSNRREFCPMVHSMLQRRRKAVQSKRATAR